MALVAEGLKSSEKSFANIFAGKLALFIFFLTLNDTAKKVKTFK